MLPGCHRESLTAEEPLAWVWVAVGGALFKIQVSPELPWHHVLEKLGKLSKSAILAEKCQRACLKQVGKNPEGTKECSLSTLPYPLPSPALSSLIPLCPLNWDRFLLCIPG